MNLNRSPIKKADNYLDELEQVNDKTSLTVAVAVCGCSGSRQ